VSITSELRDFVDELACHRCTRDMLREIADRIDQEHEECAGFCRRLEDAASKGEEVTIFGFDYVPLPTDAEGVPFHVGDHVEVPDGLPSEGKPWQVGTITRLDLGAMCWHVRVIAGGMGHTYLTENVRHYHQPTVEDVLEEFFGKANLPDGTQTRAEIIAEYAAKLRLAGDAE